MGRKRTPEGTCPYCRGQGGTHYVSCKSNRCQRCHRAPATVEGMWCGPCHLKRKAEQT